MSKGYKNFRLKAAMRECDKVQEEVAAASGMTPSTFSRKVNGQLVFDEIEIIAICKFLKKKVTDIFFINELPIG